MKPLIKILCLGGFSLIISGCFIAPLRVSEELKVLIVDAQSNNPIPNAQVLYLVHDIHEAGWKKAKMVRLTSDNNGNVEIPGRRRWGFWIPAPGGLPVPDHFIAIWAAGYAAYVFSQYDSEFELRHLEPLREDIRMALDEIPVDRSSSNRQLNPEKELSGGQIKLVRAKQ
ncbi:MAG: hypothetical protein ACHQYP_09825 [Nitrospiria bacterium]